MKIAGPTTLSGKGYVLSGYYAVGISGNAKPRLFELSSPTFGIEQFAPPYDAILLNMNRLSGGLNSAVGRKLRNSSEAIRSDRSGAFYYDTTVSLIGTCHGYGRDDVTFYSGYNFYNAFYPGGYIAPPFGETPTLIKLNQDEFANIYQGACAPLSITEYNEYFGIISKYASDAGVTSDTINPNTFHQIMSLKETCPDGTVAVTTYYEEWQGKRTPGTASSLAAPALYNNNPIPTSLDSQEIWLDGRYYYTTDSTDIHNKKNIIHFGADGRPIPSYASGDTNHSRINNNLCYAQLFETDTAIGTLTNGIQRIETPDTLWGSIGAQVSAAGQEPWSYWHFTFRENADSLPFASDMKQIRPGVTRRTLSEGTQMFTPILSSEDYYWQNRQCPDTVDYLGWNMGASIYACPSMHFDVPYYAALRKFGFYGTRFLNTCTRLELANSWNGVENALEVPSGTGIIELPWPETEPDVDTDGNWSFSLYDNLLRVAKAEERYSNMYALNRGFFLWANRPCIEAETGWANISGNAVIRQLYSGLCQRFDEVYSGGLGGLYSGEPRIVLQGNDVLGTSNIIDSGFFSEILFTNLAYEQMVQGIVHYGVSGSDLTTWENLDHRYGYYISDCQSGSGINTGFYTTMLSGREKRLRTRHMENIVRGNPIDLFPMNHITFATDNARSYLESTGWNRKTSSFGKSSRLPPIQRRYFEGAYGIGSAAKDSSNVLTSLTIANAQAFYPGFYNMYNFGKTLPLPKYVPVASGYIMDSSRRKFSASGWLAAGWNEIGALDSNFSCFTPIFVQQPLPKVFCKIGQAPTLRALAVDYHSIPDDKITPRYPEIVYWTSKLKISNSNWTNNYPMKYKWFRVAKHDYSLFAQSGDWSKASFSNPTGEWCCLEGDNRSTCTVIHPRDCSPPYASHVADAYTYLAGAQYGLDDNYYYFCMAIGRFGVRVSEPTELVIEDWTRFDVSFKNGMNLTARVTVDFVVNDIRGMTNTIRFVGEPSPNYNGYQKDKSAIPEGVAEQKIPPPNAGFGDVSATRFVGPCAYVGATRSYAPDSLKDTRGLREIWGRFLDYGTLVRFQKRLNQTEGNLLYGYKHLPECENYTMAHGKHGIQTIAYVNGYKVLHWSLPQKAFASINSRMGMRWDKINGIGSLYPPASNFYDIESPNMGIGHWQWGNNLGAIKRFGFTSRPEDNDLAIVGGGSTVDPIIFQQIKDKFIKPTTLAGANCGYTKYGMGRNMLYYIEAYGRFYLICDPVKKKNVQNISFMCPGLRNTNSAIQYCWLGKPTNTYVERRPMYGPYAYQWRVRRHNRDRNGNGISQGFYSMGYDSRYELMYDAPAIYGLYVKKEASAAYKGQAKAVAELRKKVMGMVDLAGFRSFWFGEGGSEGSFGRYGNVTFSCDPNNWAYNKDMCEYVSAAKTLASYLDFNAYSCPEDRLKAGACFDPCLSMRYSHGFFPGGKGQTMFSYSDQPSANNPPPKNLRLVANANFKNEMLLVNDEQSVIDPKVYFRSPVNTPHARVWRGLSPIYVTAQPHIEDIVGISPCRDGGSDHCNYNTPTVHLDTSCNIEGQTTAFIGSAGYAANIYAMYNVRMGD